MEIKRITLPRNDWIESDQMQENPVNYIPAQQEAIKKSDNFK
jgi:hypothetical protein